MRKGFVYGAVALWLFALLTFIWNREERDWAVEAFSELDWDQASCAVQFCGQYEGTASGEEKEELFTRIARGLGITDGYTLGWSEAGGRETLVFQKYGKNGDTQMVWAMVPEEEEIYEGTLEAMSVTIKLKSPEQFLLWQEKLGEVCRQEGFSGQSGFLLTERQKGQMGLEERNRLAEKLLSRMDVGDVFGSQTMELYTLYGYSPRISDSIFTQGQEINLNLAVSYDEIRDETVFYFGSPVLKNDF